jgi:hypothetical protein
VLLLVGPHPGHPTRVDGVTTTLHRMRFGQVQVLDGRLDPWVTAGLLVERTPRRSKAIPAMIR